MVFDWSPGEGGSYGHVMWVDDLRQGEDLPKFASRYTALRQAVRSSEAVKEGSGK